MVRKWKWGKYKKRRSEGNKRGQREANRPKQVAEKGVNAIKEEINKGKEKLRDREKGELSGGRKDRVRLECVLQMCPSLKLSFIFLQDGLNCCISSNGSNGLIMVLFCFVLLYLPCRQIIITVYPDYEDKYINIANNFVRTNLAADMF